MSSAGAQQRSLGSFNDWTAVLDASAGKKLCYAGSKPKKSEGKYTSRGDVHLLVTHRPAEKVSGEISVTAGYTYRDGKDVEAVIDGKTFKLFSRGENAWAYDANADRSMIAAMKAGRQMISPWNVRPGNADHRHLFPRRFLRCTCGDRQGLRQIDTSGCQKPDR